MTGDVDGVAVSLDWELYLNGATEAGDQEFSAFVDGTWVLGAYDAWTLGTFSEDFLTTFIVQPTGGTTHEGELELAFWEVRGRLGGGGTSTVSVLFDGVRAGTLTVTKR